MLEHPFGVRVPAQRGQLAVSTGGEVGGRCEATVPSLYRMMMSEYDGRERSRQPRTAALPLCCYMVYASLRRQGFIVFRPFSHSISGINPLAPQRFDSAEDGADIPLAFEVFEPNSAYARKRQERPAFFVFVAR